MGPAALGFSDHSGWAVMTAVRGTADGGFQLLLRQRIELCPPKLPRQVYHAVAEAGMPRTLIDEVAARSRELAGQAIARATAAVGGEVETAAVAMGRNWQPLDLDRILASHTLLHAAEGELYREALAEAAAANGLRVLRFPAKEARLTAASALESTVHAVDQCLAALGAEAGRPWTKDEKDATAAAMLALAAVASR